MNIQQFKSCIGELFGQLLLDFQEDEEYGYSNFTAADYRTIGYATNLTPEIVQQAAQHKVDLIITHHDAWGFVYGMKERCMALLEEHHIAHFYIHLPLDYAEFGTCHSLLRLLGANVVQQSQHVNGDSSIGIGELERSITLEQLAETMRELLGENIFVQPNSNRDVRRIGMVTGAGNSTNQLKEAMESQCDVYITGEKTLYTVQYAKFIQMNLIVGSHTFTEIFGVRSLACKIQEKFPDVEVIQLLEEHNEVMS
ncbi:SMS protein [Paenibacillus sp. CCS19]|uniref:Nif3-like dinuclear metal center hexameric protein n=1 Tax=Paenibacillus sp. CCS19 TaxID=3158387 RepID=UPI0025647C91|nr:Nif3-like dinuclear metal center hexameric protein [Paenibacillus cellulosilyticus]GMK41273.1 SMS protein [Paenibacillus cellulosilyticus]